MCKIFAMTSLEKITVNPKLISAVRDAVTTGGNVDGFGYAVGTKSGFFGERTLTPLRFNPAKGKGTRTLSLPIVDQVERNTFGKSGKALTLIGHGRMSTNEVCLENTHPFINSEIALIHNGVVSDHFRRVTDKLETTCDSEILLRLWEIGGIDEIEKSASGYFAIAAVDNNGLLHIAKDDRAQLSIAWCETVESFLIGTTPEVISSVAKAMQWEIEPIETVSDNTYAIFQGNELIYSREISPLGYIVGIDSKKAEKALGYRFNDSYDETDFIRDNDALYDAEYDDTDQIDADDLVTLMNRGKYGVR
jgi:hypothetical protein